MTTNDNAVAREAQDLSTYEQLPGMYTEFKDLLAEVTQDEELISKCLDQYRKTLDVVSPDPFVGEDLLVDGDDGLSLDEQEMIDRAIQKILSR